MMSEKGSEKRESLDSEKVEDNEEETKKEEKDDNKEVKDECNQCGGTIEGWVYKNYIIAYSKLMDLIRTKKKITTDDIRTCMTWEVGSRVCEIFSNHYLMKTFSEIANENKGISSDEILYMALGRMSKKYTRAFWHLAKKLKLSESTIKKIKEMGDNELKREKDISK